MEEEYSLPYRPECWDVWDERDARSLARDYCLGECAEDPSEEECMEECVESEYFLEGHKEYYMHGLMEDI